MGAGWASLLASAVSVLWLGGFSLRVGSALRAPRLERLRSPDPPEWPRLSVVIAAKDEAETLEPALTSLLAADYPALEIVFVDDRSTDATPEIAARVASGDPRLVYARVDAVPSGWLGKVNALEHGLARATGDLVLFSDADVRFAPEALRRAVALAEALALDHLVVLPRLTERGPLQSALMAVFVDGTVERLLLSRDVVLRSPRAFGYGAFNLLRRRALPDGLGWIKMDVLDDLAIGEIVRVAGGRRGFVLGEEHVEVLWYPTLGEALRGMQKNLFGGVAGYSIPVSLLLAVLLFTLPAAPLLSLALGGVPGVLGGAVIAVHVVSAFVMARAHRAGVTGRLLMPLGLWALAWGLVASAVATTRRGGVLWRGTFYSLDELRAGRRVRYP